MVFRAFPCYLYKGRVEAEHTEQNKEKSNELNRAFSKRCLLFGSSFQLFKFLNIFVFFNLTSPLKF
jgi:hypothetical protein